MDMSQETDMVLKQHLRNMNNQSSPGQAPLTEIGVLAGSCVGTLELFGEWGTKSRVYIAVEGPPKMKKYHLGVWKAQGERDKGGRCDPAIDLLRISSVLPDPKRTDTFMIQYLDQDKIKQRMQFRIVDRSRDIWCELLMNLIKLLHADK